MQILTAQRLRELFEYDPVTGVFTRRITVGGEVAGSVAGYVDTLGYVVFAVDGKSHKAHRLAWLYMTGQWPDHDIDHIDRSRNNNKFENLREATESQNLANSKRRSDNTSGYKGVRFYPPNGKWLARISCQGQRKHLGYFDTAIEAHQKYVDAAIVAFGEFARTA